MFCIPLCAELHEGVKDIRRLQNKVEPEIDGLPKVTITTLMAKMAADIVPTLGRRCLLVLDAYFAVGPVFVILKSVVDNAGDRLIHVVTRAKSNVVGYEDPPPRTGKRGRPRKFGLKVKLTKLFDTRTAMFEPLSIDLYGHCRDITFLCLDLVWKPVGEKVRFVLVQDGSDRFILMSSDLTLSAADIILAYSYRFKIELSFKMMKHVVGAFFYRFWTRAWPRVTQKAAVDLSKIADHRRCRLIQQTTDAIEGFVNFGCIATGILQILALNCHQKIWRDYAGWLRTITSTIPSEEVVKSVIQQEFFHNFDLFSNTAIYRIITSKTERASADRLPLSA